MPAKKNTDMRRRGRPPKQKYFSAAELQAKSLKSIEQSRARYSNHIDHVNAEHVVNLMSDSAALQTLSTEELQALRNEAEALWELLGYTREYEEDRQYLNNNQLTDEEFLDQPACSGQMSRKEWIQAHAFLKPKRKNARLPKAIKDIRKNKYEQYGLTDQQPEPIDLDGMEAEIEKKLMDKAAAEMAEAKKKRGHVGKRLRQPTPEPRRSAIDTSKFWT